MSTLYEKRGRRYYPIMEFDTFDAWPHGAHLVVSKPGSRVTRFNVDPADAPLVAAAERHRENIRRCVSKHLEMRPTRKPVTLKQAAAWQRFRKEMGNDGYIVEYPSIAELADAVVELIINATKEAPQNEDPQF